MAIRTEDIRDHASPYFGELRIRRVFNGTRPVDMRRLIEDAAMLRQEQGFDHRM